ncbi:MAG: hypothetical protein AB1938_13955 [Myxococcota bacterium]
MTNRNVLTVRGFTAQKPVGGYEWTIEATVRAPAAGETKGAIQLKMVGTADGAAAFIRGVPADFVVSEKVELVEWKDKHGDCDLVVVDGQGAELFRGSVKL